MRRPTRSTLTAVAVAGVLGALAPAALPVTGVTARGSSPSAVSSPGTVSSQDASSLPDVDSGARPGPDVLYADAPEAPQLANHDPVFVAPFDRVSGTERYVDGEYLYTDHIYDDSGDELTYPTDIDRFGNNAADLVEFRISTREADVTHYRFTLNTLLREDTTRVAVAFDDGDPTTGTDQLPGDPGAPFPGTDMVLSTWGTGAEWSTWDVTSQTWAVDDVPVHADVDANQITVQVPAGVAAPTGTWKVALAVGLESPGGGFLPPEESATASEPGGGEGKAAIFNLGFRFDESILDDSEPPDADQSEALAAKEPTRYSHAIDFTGLRDGVVADKVPRTGTMVRFFPSRLELGEGRDTDSFPAQLGQLQPYSLYVPSTYRGERTKLTLNLHSLGQRHWQYNGSTGVEQLGEERHSLVATADARGTNGWYQHEAEYDVFEMWNDIARHFPLDASGTTTTGYSMGGYGTYRLGTLYPDLFAAAVTVVGPPGDGIWFGAGAPTGGAETLSNLWLENARNVPYMNIVAAADELVPISGTTQQNVGPAQNGRTSFDALGYRYAFDVYPAAEHLTLAILGYNLPQAAEFLGDATVDLNPFHVTFAYTPAADDPELGLVHDHAYWLSGVQLADPTVGVVVSSREDPVGKGVVDVESLAFGLDDPQPEKGVGAGTVPLPYTEVNQTWGEAVARDAVNGFELRLTNIGAATLDLARASVTSTEPIEVHYDTDTAATVTLVDGLSRSADIEVPAGTGVLTVEPDAFDDGDDDGNGNGNGAENRCEPDHAAEPRDRNCRNDEDGGA